MSDIGDWLRQLGLERYEQAFRHNDIVPSVLPALTDADLKELGPTLGHRRLLLRAIQELERTGTARTRVPLNRPGRQHPGPPSGGS